MKKLMLIAVLSLVALSGCLPNTRKGWSQDTIDRETRTIQKMDQQIYSRNKEILPMRMNQVEESVGFQGRMQARMKAMRENN